MSWCVVNQGERLAIEDQRRGPDQQGPEAGGEGGAERRRAHQHGGAQAQVPGREAHHSRPHQPHGTQGYLSSSSPQQSDGIDFKCDALPAVYLPDSGIGLEGGVYVTAIVQGSPAAREGSLTAGDRLIAVSSLLIFTHTFFFHPATAHTDSLVFLIQALFHSSIQSPKPQIRWDLVEYVK